MKWWKKSFVFLFKNSTRIHDQEKEKNPHEEEPQSVSPARYICSCRKTVTSSPCDIAESSSNWKDKSHVILA
jgi:hypothetical protein